MKRFKVEDQNLINHQYKLLLKTHFDTGVNYLCVTKRKDFVVYPGSGIAWKRLLAKYPESEILTNLLYSSDVLQEFNIVCLYYSCLLDVVNSNAYANLVPEQGYQNLDGKSNLNLWWEFASEDQKAPVIEKRTKNMINTVQSSGRTLMEEARQASREFARENGYENVSQIPEIKEKTKKSRIETLLKLYGVDNSTKIPGVADKIKKLRVDTLNEKYGVDHPLQIPGMGKLVHEKRTKTLLEKYGVENPSQIPEFKEQISKSISQSMKNREIRKCKYCSFESKNNTFHEKYYCKENKDRTEPEKKVCEHCSKVCSSANYSRWHGDNCKHNKGENI